LTKLLRQRRMRQCILIDFLEQPTRSGHATDSTQLTFGHTCFPSNLVVGHTAVLRNNRRYLEST
jgi:hypothetical protein